MVIHTGGKMNYVENTKKNMLARNKYFHECQKKEIPFVVVTHGGKYSAVEWDYISISPKLDKKIVGNKQLLSTFQDIFSDYANEKSTYEMSSGFGAIKKLTADNAMSAANDIFSALQSEINA